MPTIIGSILSIISNVVGGVTAEQQAKIALALQENEDMTRLLTAQANIDANEAANPNWFVAGARPCIMWVCAASFAWTYLIQPMITYFCVISGHPIPPLPVITSGDLMTVMLGMLGLGGMRSWEKINNVQNKH